MPISRMLSRIILTSLVAVFAAPAWTQLNDQCVVADNGTGTVTLPPVGCGLKQPQEVFMIIDGLPAGTRLELDGTHGAFHCDAPAGIGPCLVENGGIFGGQRELFNGVMVFEIRGVGSLASFRRVINIDTTVETQSAPRTPGNPVQNFDTGIISLLGSLPPGDPDFAQLNLISGSNFGLNSFGHTSLTDRGDGTFLVDRFYDVGYQIVFQGAPGGALDGLSGTTTGTTRMEMRSVRPERRCVSPDDGSGSVRLPPDGCGYLSPRQEFQIIAGLPPGTVLELAPLFEPFVCTGGGGACGVAGGNLGGQRQLFDSTLRLYLEGTGSMSEFRRSLRVPVSMETHSAPRTPGEPVQAFVTDLFDLQGALTGDPDFASLTVVGGSSNGLPSLGHTTLADLGDGSFQVDSFFDISYQIDFVGAPGGTLDGLSGSTQASVRVEARDDKINAVEAGNGAGTVTMPPERSEYRSRNDVLIVLAGPRVIEFDASLAPFFCTTPGCAEAGGNLGGAREVYTSTLDLVISGALGFPSLNRHIELPVTVETHSAPRIPGDSVQRFDTDLFHLQGALLGDPDFSELSITAGTDNGLPSPGHTTITELGGGSFLVDSFFDITYQIDFVGAPGSVLDGFSGSTERTIRLEAYEREGAAAHNVTIVVGTEPQGLADIDFTGDLGSFSLDDDADPALSDRRTFNNLTPGVFSVTAAAATGTILRGIVCDDPDGGTSVDLGAGQVMIDLDLGEAISCVYSHVGELILVDGFE